ncbi:MAG TPA: hypothetical protein VID70_01880 [Solirubrobacteraceae bacterium]
MFPSNDPTPDMAEVQQEVRWTRQRPLLAGVLLLGVLGFGYWFVMLGGGASGSTAQAEQLIRNATSTAPGQPIGGSQVATVHCTENGQSVLARLASFFQGGSPGDQQRAKPGTDYTCSGTTVGGTPVDWCVLFPPSGNTGNWPPEITIRQPAESCPA